MVSIYYLSGFNNYYNRTILLPQSTLLADYEDYLLKVDEVENFNPNDNVMTELTVNYWGTDEDISDLLNIDYVLISSDNRTIDSKWFALDRQRIRGQQWHFTLRRDLVSDNYEAVISAPCFIEKATLPADSPLIWNKENMTFNQIKEEEILLKDASNCPWIVGYIARGGDVSAVNEYIEVPFGLEPEADVIYDDIEDEDVWKYRYTESLGDNTQTMVRPTEISIQVNYKMTNTYYGYSFFKINNKAPYNLTFDKTNIWSSKTNGYDYIVQIPQSTVQSQITATWADTAKYVEENIHSYTTDTHYTIDAERADNLLALDNKIVYDSNAQKYYRVNAKETISGAPFTGDIESGGLFNTLKNGIAKAELNGRDFFTGQPDQYTFGFSIKGSYIRVELTEIYQRSGKVKIHANEPNRITCWDSPFDIICAPYGDKTIITADGSYIQSKDTSFAAMMAYAENQGGGESPALYDLQLLPYCPIPNCITDDGDIDVGNRQYGVIEDADEEEIGRIFYVAQSQFSIDIPYVIEVPSSSVDKKVMNECEMYRLCSPNFNGAFEFSPAKNGGVQWFNVDCQYKPFSPYIHVNPNFNEEGMYGIDFNDARGLICGGDFSLSMASDAWATYQRQNKNYQQIFDRQIENMEISNSIQREKEIVETIVGAGTTALSGAGTGMMLGGPAMSAAMAVGGGALSALGGIRDIQLNDKLRAEALDMTKDMFGYNLGNIQALPNSLTKVSAYNNNNKIFPLLEKYSATEKEKQALRDKLTYDGMTAMVIGTIAEYKQATPSYIKGRLIRLLNSQTLDFHGLSELANEIYKGVFI